MKSPFWLPVLFLLVSACAPLSNPPAERALADYGPAPELTNSVWLNAPHPLRLKDLRGKVVLLDMWTFACINCQHTLPALKSWNERYAGQGLVVIGNHYPEFEYEQSLDNLKKAISEQKIVYPIAQDNDGATWSGYHTLYWPTMYLIDKRGEIRYLAVGEGQYDRTEQAIQTLLAEPPAKE